MVIFCRPKYNTNNRILETRWNIVAFWLMFVKLYRQHSIMCRFNAIVSSISPASCYYAARILCIHTLWYCIPCTCAHPFNEKLIYIIYIYFYFKFEQNAILASYYSSIFSVSALCSLSLSLDAVVMPFTAKFLFKFIANQEQTWNVIISHVFYVHALIDKSVIQSWKTYIIK